MKMITVLIIDDDPESVTLLSKSLELYNDKLKLTGTTDSVATGEKLIKDLNPQVVFLDISMRGENGLGFLERWKDRSFEVIFITAHHEYAVEAFKYSATHYLLKPLDPDALDDAVNRCLIRHEEKNLLNRNAAFSRSGSLVISTQNGKIIVAVNSIIRLQTEGNYTHIFLDNEKPILASQSIKNYEIKLASRDFIRPHKSHLVNPGFIKSYSKGKGGTIILKNQDIIPISFRKRKELIQKLEEYFK